MVKQVKNTLNHIQSKDVEKRLFNLDSTSATDCSLRKITTSLKISLVFQSPLRRDDGSWAKSDAEKSELFAEHLSRVFIPNPAMNLTKEDEVIKALQSLTSQHLPSKKLLSMKSTQPFELPKDLNKAPGYDLVITKVMKELPHSTLVLLTAIFNAIL